MRNLAPGKALRHIVAGSLGALALSTAMVGTASAAADAVVFSNGGLADLQPAAPNPTDEAQAQVFAVPTGDSTMFFLLLYGLDPAAAGQTFGAHIHVGPCVAGNGGAAGPHFNTTGGAVITPQTEVWLDFTILPGGVAFSQTTVPFVIAPGAAQSLVVHQLPTQVGGATPGVAGGRIACLPVDFGSPGVDV